MSRKNRIKWGIVLTTTVNVHKVGLKQKNKEERIKTYLASIHQWLLTDLPIIVVENSGYTFPELKGTRAEVITFKSMDDVDFLHFMKFLKLNEKGLYELRAIRYACEHSKLLKKCTHFMKVTGRYFIPSLESILKKLPYSTKAVRQHNAYELLGCRKDYIDTIFDYIIVDKNNKIVKNSIEKIYHDRISSIPHVVLPMMSIHEESEMIENRVIQDFKTPCTLYTAVIIEPRVHKALPFVIKNALHGLNNDWTILILCSSININQVKTMLCERVKYKMVFDKNITKEEYSQFCASEYFHSLIPTETFLLFQTDSMILNPSKLGKFLKYDYVGAPWDHGVGNGVGNGGFSLRKKSKMLEIIKTVPYLGEAEDLYFCKQTSVKLHRPSLEEAKEFSVEYLFHPSPFGTHQTWAGKDYSKMVELYPAIKVLKHANYI